MGTTDAEEPVNKTTCPDCGKNIVGRRYPIEPLAEFMGHAPSARTVNVSGQTWTAALCHGFTRRTVDRIAGEQRFHPAEVWPEIIGHDIEDAEVECADDDCTRRFVPSRAGHKFCSRTCSTRRPKREWKNNRYRNDPEYREAAKAKVRKHQAEVAEYRARYMRSWRARKRAEAA